MYEECSELEGSLGLFQLQHGTGIFFCILGRSTMYIRRIIHFHLVYSQPLFVLAFYPPACLKQTNRKCVRNILAIVYFFYAFRRSPAIQPSVKWPFFNQENLACASTLTKSAKHFIFSRLQQLNLAICLEREVKLFKICLDCTLFRWLFLDPVECLPSFS